MGKSATVNYHVYILAFTVYLCVLLISASVSDLNTFLVLDQHAVDVQYG